MLNEFEELYSCVTVSFLRACSALKVFFKPFIFLPFTPHIHPVNRKTTSLKIISSLTLKSHISSQNTGLKNTLKSGRNAVQLGLSANTDNKIQSSETISSVYFIINPWSVDVVTDNTL